jgi:hypothetical protein
MPIIADIGGGPFIVFFGSVGVVILVLVIGVEACVLWLLKWGSPWRSFLASLFVNLISTFIGGVITIILLTSSTLITSITLFLLLSWLPTVAIEALMLWLLASLPTRALWIASFAMNTASYILLLGILYLFRP